MTCRSNLGLISNTMGSAAGLSPDLTAHLAPFRLNCSYGYGSERDQPDCTREINRQFRQLMHYAG